MEMNPLQKGQVCYGDDLRRLTEPPPFTLSFFVKWLNKFKNKEEFLIRSQWFNQLMGNDLVLKLILEEKKEPEIRKSWQAELTAYGTIRQKYLLYPDINPDK